MLNFNRNNFTDRSLNQTLNELIERPPLARLTGDTALTMNA